MGVFEWLFLAVVILHSIRVYKTQDYWLDRQIARLFRYIRSLFTDKGHKQ